MHFDSYFTEVCSYVSNWKYVNTGSGKGLAPIGQWVLTWFNIDQDTMGPFTSMDYFNPSMDK